MSTPLHFTSLELRPQRWTWIKRRARNLHTFWGVPKRVAIHHAWCDYVSFSHDRSAMPPKLLRLVPAPRRGA